MHRLPLNKLRKYKSSINKIANFELFDAIPPIPKKEAFKIAKRRNKHYRKIIKYIKQK